MAGGAVERWSGTDEERLSSRLRVGRTQDRNRLERLYYAEAQHARVDTPLGRKDVPLRRFAAEAGVPLGQVASVGNSSPDISMFRASGLGIAFRPTDEHVRAWADVVLAGASLVEVVGPVLGHGP